MRFPASKFFPVTAARTISTTTKLKDGIQKMELLTTFETELETARCKLRELSSEHSDAAKLVDGLKQTLNEIRVEHQAASDKAFEETRTVLGPDRREAEAERAIGTAERRAGILHQLTE